MDAFILAAGLGTRLRPLTERMPKALVRVAGVSMLERVARRLIAAGADRLIVNVHPHPEQIIRCLTDAGGFGVPWVVSYEPDQPLDTGGALLHARDLIRREQPFYLHNVDVLTDFPLRDMYDAHLRSGAAATVAVSVRESRRGLIFGPGGLCGRYDGEREWRAGGSAQAASGDAGAIEGRFAFAGVHVISPWVLDRIEEKGAFPVLDLYLRLAGEGQRVAGYRIDGHAWFDIGSPEKLAVAEAALQATSPAGPTER